MECQAASNSAIDDDGDGDMWWGAVPFAELQLDQHACPIRLSLVPICRPSELWHA
jgi:hypothetical protein